MVCDGAREKRHAEAGHPVSHPIFPSRVWERRVAKNGSVCCGGSFSFSDSFDSSPLATSPTCSWSIPCFLFAVARFLLSGRRGVPTQRTPCWASFQRRSFRLSGHAREPRSSFRVRSVEHVSVQAGPFHGVSSTTSTCVLRSVRSFLPRTSTCLSGRSWTPLVPPIAREEARKDGRSAAGKARNGRARNKPHRSS